MDCHNVIFLLPGQLEVQLAESEQLLGDIMTAIRTKVQKVSLGEIPVLGYIMW